MPVEVVMPKFGLTMQEGIIRQWFKEEGEPITEGEPLFEVETEKVLTEVPAPATGQVAKRLFPPESTVACAEVVAVIAVAGEDPAAIAAQYVARAAEPLPAPARASNPTAVVPMKAAPVTPAARKLAKEHGIDLAILRGTGPGGRITHEDVEVAIERAAAVPKTPAAQLLRGMRKAIAEHMFESLRSTAQLTITTEADVSALVERRERLKSEFPFTYTDLLIEAVARALQEHPQLNATAREGALQPQAEIHVGVAVALREGLIVPVIRNADRKSLRQIAEESRALADKAQAGAPSVDDVSGGTFTVSNLGAYGVDAFTPILHTPQIAILGVGRIVEKPAVHEGKIVPRFMMMLSLTFDHRFIDGAPAAAFLQSVVKHLQLERVGTSTA